MNERISTEKQNQVSGHVFHGDQPRGSMDPVAGRSSHASATAVDLPSPFPVGVGAVPAGRFKRRSQSTSDVDIEAHGDRSSRSPRWHKFVRKYPATVGLFCVTFPIAVIAQILVMVHL